MTKNISIIDKTRLPRHIGIIMDGNGRWALERGLDRSEGHVQGAKALEKISEYCAKLEIKMLTVFAFSVENWLRPESEVNHLMNLMCEYLLDAHNTIGRLGVALRVIGDLEALSEPLRMAVSYAQEATRHHKGMIMNVALNYSGKNEILRAMRLAIDAVGVENLDEEILGNFLMTAPFTDVDFIIRTSGERRISNFLLWQLAYAEFWFSDVNWPDFGVSDMERAIIDFQSRKRRYGML